MYETEGLHGNEDLDYDLLSRNSTVLCVCTNILEDPLAASNSGAKCGLPITLCHNPEDRNPNTVQALKNMGFLTVNTSLKAGKLIYSKYYFVFLFNYF
jgi:hypothetical protein